jgi:hypothetical protein
MKSTIRLAVITCLALGCAATAAPETRSADNVAWLTFRTPSKKIACAWVPTTLRCDVLPELRPQPRARCELDWTGLQLSSHERARAVCAGDTVNTGRAPVLRYGQTWRRARITCTVTRAVGLRCRNRAGRGFVLTIRRWDTF